MAGFRYRIDGTVTDQYGNPVGPLTDGEITALAVVTSPVWLFGLAISTFVGVGMFAAVVLTGLSWIGRLSSSLAGRIGVWAWIALILVAVSLPVVAVVASAERRAKVMARGVRPRSQFAPRPDVTAVVGRRLAGSLVDGFVVLGFATMIAVPLYSSMAVADTTGRIDCSADVILDEQGRRLNDVLCVDDGSGTVTYVPADRVGWFWAVTLTSAAYLAVLDLVILTGVTGASVGKFVVGVRVVQPDSGAPPGMLLAGLRLGALLTVDSLCGCLGLVVAAVERRHRRVGDLLARTIVVSVR